METNIAITPRQTLKVGENCTIPDDLLFDHFVSIGKNVAIGSGVSIGFNSRIGNNLEIQEDVIIGNNVVIGDDLCIGKGTIIENSVEVGYSNMTRKKVYYEELPTLIGRECIIRSGAIIYRTCSLGDRSWIGNYSVIRENTVIGKDTTIGAHVMCEGYTTIGNHVKIYSFCELGGNQIIEDHVFIGPGTTTSNNPRPVVKSQFATNFRWDDGRQKVIDKGPNIRKGAKIGIASTLLADIEIGCDALVGAGSVVTRNVPPNVIVKGIPAKVAGEVPEHERMCE